MRSWVEIDANNLRYNLDILKSKVKDIEILGIVKNNGYGFGAVGISKLLVEYGIKILAVATLSEAIELQQNGIEAEILVLGALLDEELEEAAKRKLHINVSEFEQLELLAKKDKEFNNNLKIHIKINTGLTRLGFDTKEALLAIEYAKSHDLNLVGIFSHFSDANNPTEEAIKFTHLQIEKFKQFDNIKGIKYRHMFNSSGIINYESELMGNIVRPGIAMYGLLDGKKLEGFKNVFTLKTKISFLKTVKEDSYVSYGRNFLLKKGETYAALAIGYGDLLQKAYFKDFYVYILGEKCPIIGNICMDITMVKIPDSIVGQVKKGLEVIVLNNDIVEEIKADNFCAGCLFSAIGKRVERIYK